MKIFTYHFHKENGKKRFTKDFIYLGLHSLETDKKLSSTPLFVHSFGIHFLLYIKCGKVRMSVAWHICSQAKYQAMHNSLKIISSVVMERQEMPIPKKEFRLGKNLSNRKTSPASVLTTTTFALPFLLLYKTSPSALSSSHSCMPQRTISKKPPHPKPILSTNQSNLILPLPSRSDHTHQRYVV